MSDIQKARQENASNEALVQRINELENMLRNQQSQEQETRQQQSVMSPGGAPSQHTPSQHTHSSPSPAPLAMETDEQVSPPLLARLDLDRESTTPLVSNFFSYIHPKFPVVDQESFPELFERTFRVDCNYDADLAVCLLVLALGELGSTESAVDPSQDMPGMSYFGLAYRILMMQWAASFSPSLSLPTGLILAGVYLCFKAQPLAAWKMACMASNSLQLLAQQSVSDTYLLKPLKLMNCRPTADVRNANENEMLSRLCWTCFVIEW
ncbi:hypothetical protein FSOLCH5_013893 [Fusarium solani]